MAAISPILSKMEKKKVISTTVIHAGFSGRPATEAFRGPLLHLGSTRGNRAHQTAAIMEKFEMIVHEGRPDLIVIVGGGNAALAGGLVGVKMNIPLARLGAGLRSQNRGKPEEINGLVADHVSTLLFAPGRAESAILAGEGIDTGKIHIVGRNATGGGAKKTGYVESTSAAGIVDTMEKFLLRALKPGRHEKKSLSAL